MGLPPGPRPEVSSTPALASGFRSYGERRRSSLLNTRRERSASRQRTSGLGTGCVRPLGLAVRPPVRVRRFRCLRAPWGVRHSTWTRELGRLQVLVPQARHRCASPEATTEGFIIFFSKINLEIVQN